MQILKGTGIDWCERRLIKKLYMNQRLKYNWTEKRQKSVKTGRGVRQRCCLSPIPFNLLGEYLIKKALKGFGDFKIGGQVICTVKYPEAKE
jgi:hypothetical protein